ncbi:unnamed protein product [Porites lobata]|uniref:Uncharacterized protein n=2 Tax=Porites TaxID=46719 RepID=A0ABN8PFV9_9CNID|nr:unnamed protein product [Porites lobata]
MYGSSMGTLNVRVGNSTIFTKSGNQGNKWIKASVEINNPDPGASTLIFEGIRGRIFTGDAAIDNVELRECGGGGGGGGGCGQTTTAPPIKPFSCNFDNSTCGFVQAKNDTFDWTRRSGSTPSSLTGPSSDHTSGKGYYMYIEASYPRVKGDNAILERPLLTFGGNMCFKFFYHMYGATIGSLRVKIGTQTVFTAIGQKGNKWIEAAVNVRFSGKYQISFEGVRGSSYAGDIAIDDVSLVPGSCSSVTPSPPSTPAPPTPSVTTRPPSTTLTPSTPSVGTPPPPPPGTPPPPTGCPGVTPCPPPAITCNFDVSMCGFQQDKNDKFDWTRHKGATLSSGTGPSGDHTSGKGYYMYIETSSPRVQGDNAKLKSPPLKFSGTMCLSFYYHMYGSDIGSLKVSFNGKDVFSRSGNKGNTWLKASVSISSIAGSHQIIFEGVRGKSFEGDIAIDDFSLTSGSCAGVTPPPPSTPAPPTPSATICSFDASMCGFLQDKNDKFDWTRQKGPTLSSGTGPSSDHTSGNGYYMYIETSSPRVSGDNAKLRSPSLKFSGNMCLGFFYHMYGSNIGSLKVSINGKEVFSRSGNKGNTWLKASVTISSIVGSHQIIFEGVRGKSFEGDIAIDDFSLTSGSCAGANICSFDASMCGFLQDKNDKFDWTRQKGPTSSSGTGPSSDHTSGNGYYMYIETSSPRVSGDNAKLRSPSLKFSGNMCLGFFYHMYGSNIGSLKVSINSKQVFSRSGNKGNTWLKASVTISSIVGSHQITFEGIRGVSFEGDIAIDDFSLTPGSCPVTTPPPTASPPPPGSCGVRPHARIVGGVAANHGSWPWQAMLRTTSGFPYCGGSLVHREWVVTATHCVTGKSPSSIFIRLGAHRRVIAVGTEQDIRVSKVITHPSYHTPLRYSHDIALLKLSRPANLTKYVNLVCLPHAVAAPTDGTRCWITGWGRLASGGASPDYLQQVSVPVVSRARCDRAYPGKIHDSMICAGLDQGGIDTCQGDSGGPMVCETGGRYYLQGATSWGYGCASAGKFGVYAKSSFSNLKVSRFCQRTSGSFQTLPRGPLVSALPAPKVDSLCTYPPPLPPSFIEGRSLTPIVQSRVIGGQNAKPGAWPWQIALKRYGRFICGGSLISSQWVVTAAHCVAGSSNPLSYKIVVGDHNRNINEGTEEEVGAKKVISHPNYNSPRLSSDIALIQLSSPVKLSQRVNPICLPNHDSDVPTGSKCYITGWGKIKHPGSSYHILQQAMMPPIDNAKCRQKIQSSGVAISLTPQMLCAGVENTILSGCHGDSGGPYVCLNADGKTYTLHGAVSWGSARCDAKQLFSVFARVTQFRAWIKTHTGLGGGGSGSPPPPHTPPIPTTPAGKLVFSCDFNKLKDLCGFVQSKNDKFNWTQRSGSTPSVNTGPSADVSKSGKYVYIETSSPRVQGDNAILVRSGLSFSPKKCLSFYYHMYGSSMGTLNVRVGNSTIFTKSGNQGNKWIKASVEINNPDPGASTLIFEGIRGRIFTGDAAIDNVELRECGGGGGGGGGCGKLNRILFNKPPAPSQTTTAPPIKPFSCNFDNSTCGFVQAKNDTFDWTRRSGSTPSSLTGPSSDHTSGKGYYMYIEASYPRVKGDNAILERPLLTFGGNMCFKFFYHMYGATIGSLRVKIGTQTVFTAIGQKGNKWIEAAVNVRFSGKYQISFEGVRGSSYAGDIAIDDVSLVPGSCSSVTPPPPSTPAPPTPSVTPCPPPAITCNFDVSMCGFQQDKNDKFDWTRHKGATLSSGTGPSGDHTSGKGYYMYIETSSPRVQGDNAKLKSRPLKFSGTMCLSFYYHMYGSDIGSLKVSINGKEVFSRSGNKGNAWLKASVSISSIGGSHQIIFEGVRGKSFEGDIAIDDFSLTSGSCAGVTPPPPSTPAPPTPSATICSFDASMCGFLQDKNDKFDWTRLKGPTSSSGTGPSSDHTSGNGYYMYIETSSPRVSGDNAKLRSPSLKFSGNMCLGFFYHMYGSNIGSLKVSINSKQVFSRSGNKGNTWLKASVTISSIVGSHQITFEGIRV